jgi:2-oxoglutarate ferredoxin oxidoreductase subunit alpha
MCPDLKWDDNYVPDRGKVYTKDDLLKMEKFHRYLDVDGDGIPYRTLPGVHPKGAYFTRGSGHTQYGAYTEDSADYQIVLDRLTRKFATAKRLVPAPVIEQDAKTDIAIVAYGSSDGAVREARDILRSHGLNTNYLRLRAFPFGEDVEKFLEAHRLVFVVEQNRDAQMRSLLTLETRVEKHQLRSLLHYSGLPISSEFIVKGILAEVEPKTRKPEVVVAGKAAGGAA